MDKPTSLITSDKEVSLVNEENMQRLETSFFSEAQLPNLGMAVEFATDTVNAAGGLVVTNFSPEEQFPVGYGLAILPIKQRDETARKTITIGVCIAAIPENALIEKSTEGSLWLSRVVLEAKLAKVRNAARPRKNGDVAATLPFSVDEFVTSNRAEGILVAYNKYAADYIKVLKDKGLTLLTSAILRSILSSTAVAEQLYSKLPQTFWDAILQSMIERARADGVQEGILPEWKRERYNAGLPEVSEDAIAGLDFEGFGLSED